MARIEKPPSMTSAAHAAGLRYVFDDAPGITRRRRGQSFAYFDPKRRAIRARPVLERIQKLAIPPAWTHVWICADETGHLQATGRDARGRKQYRYHEDWRKVRDETKYHHMIAFAHALPRLRARVRRDLARPGLPREKVLATVARLLEISLIRVGNEEYARTNGSFGLTTFRRRHVDVKGGTVLFSFRGKSGKNHRIDVQNRRLAAVVRRCRDLPGQQLFAYVDESGRPVDVTSSDVNDYLQHITGQPFTAKDFRTWAGTVLAAQALSGFDDFATKAEARKNLLTAVERVSSQLGNTPAICRRCYIHPLILETYLDGTLVTRLKKIVEQKLSRDLRRLRSDEAAVLMLLQQTFPGRKSGVRRRTV
jgi:DNA topoisomerase-1